ncbi:MAG: ATP-dependent zinc metalloprotease FtsH [Candidatus Pacebacteria bacterium]|nr:ATP-dependent zinc metalloprotease FtsH [Candidatus Paceibacterota bacterium]
MDLKNKQFSNKKPTNGSKKMPGFGGGPMSVFSKILNAILIILIFSTLWSMFLTGNAKKEQISLSQLSQDITLGIVDKVEVKGDSLSIIYFSTSTEASTTALVKESKKEEGVALTQTLSNYQVPQDKLAKINIEILSDTGFSYWFINLAPFLIPIILIGFFVWMLTKQMKGAGVQALSFGQSKARIILPNDKKQKITFADVAGAKEAKEELSEVVDFLKNPKKFLDIGAKIPKGLLLMGAPGTGKTLLARAVAGEAGVAFFSISGSEFVEMFVGVGASRVRDLFQMAKRAAPAIIFIDEIDAVGRVRGSGMGGGNDEREQTLNQILVEMDGFEQNEKVIVMAATNRPDVLDSALLRPGRFDRRVVIDLPDRNDREAILKVHSKSKPFAEDVNLRTIAERTPGFSGADLYSLMNEAAILAARESRQKVSQFDLIRSIEKVMMGPERKSHLLSIKEKEITAYHEAGHALVASLLPYADPVHKISIISRGRAAGYTLHLPFEDRKMQSKKEFLDDIAMALGGYVVEKMVFKDLTTGPSNDLQVSTALARDMVTKYGMSEKMGPVALEGEGGRALFGKGVNDKEYSDKINAQIDEEVSEIMNSNMKRAEKIITEHKGALDAIAKRLIETETIEREEFEKILVANGIIPKKKEDIEHQS